MEIFEILQFHNIMTYTFWQTKINACIKTITLILMVQILDLKDYIFCIGCIVTKRLSVSALFDFQILM